MKLVIMPTKFLQGWLSIVTLIAEAERAAFNDPGSVSVSERIFPLNELEFTTGTFVKKV